MMKLKRLLRFNILPVILLLLSTMNYQLSTAYADTIYTNDGKELKGIIVEDYKDRMVFSTADGEITVMKSDVKEIYIDSEEDNLIKLADQALDRRDYGRSFAYYEKALKLNPDSKRAKDGVVFLQGYLLSRDEAAKLEAVRRQAEYERTQEAAIGVDYSEERLREGLGISLKMKNGFPQVADVELKSSAYEAGIRKGDLLVSVWGKLTGYMSLEEAVGKLLDKTSFEIKCAIERAVDVPISENRNILAGSNELIGASFKMEFDGLTISDVRLPGTGLEKGDLVTAIDGQSTRYTPLKNAVDMIRSSKNNKVRLTIKREITIWGKG